MSEYVSKKAVLEHIRHEIGIIERQQDAVMTRHMKEFYGGAIRALQNLEHAIQSGAFDADESEVQQLRAALERIAAVDVFDWSDETFQGCVDIAREALSTTSEPTVAERVRDKMKSLFEAWDLRGICKDSLEGYEQGVMLELIGLCEEIAGINAPETKQDDDLLGDWIDYHHDIPSVKTKTMAELAKLAGLEEQA